MTPERDLDKEIEEYHRIAYRLARKINYCAKNNPESLDKALDDFSEHVVMEGPAFFNDELEYYGVKVSDLSPKIPMELLRKED